MINKIIYKNLKKFYKTIKITKKNGIKLWKKYKTK